MKTLILLLLLCTSCTVSERTTQREPVKYEYQYWYNATTGEWGWIVVPKR